MKILIHQLVIVRSPPHVLLTLSHILINFQVIHHERIHALAKPISRQTQDNSYSKFAFAKPSALSHSERRRGDYLSTGCGNAIRSRQPFAFANAYIFYTLDIHNDKQLN
ncbi:hypothetical protein TNCV_692611 [Trichonephila clavipes]|nr:hypothetical protein TNCV_692611 [Trichonephila clavipes]